MTMDPPRTFIVALGVGSKYLVFIGGEFTPVNYYQFIDIKDVTTNEQYSIPFPSSWFTYATGLGINIHKLQKLVVYSVDQSAILIIDPATRSVNEIASAGMRQAVTNGTHLFAFTREGPKVLDVQRLTWSDLINFPTPTVGNWGWAYVHSINAISLTRIAIPLLMQFYSLNGTELKTIAFPGKINEKL